MHGSFNNRNHMIRTLLLSTISFLCLNSIGQNVSYSPTSLNTWGDQGNGTYINPILNADYSDPDVIRVGNKYYMVASDFHFLGKHILEEVVMVQDLSLFIR